MQKRRNFVANALEFRHFCIKPSTIYHLGLPNFALLLYVLDQYR